MNRNLYGYEGNYFKLKNRLPFEKVQNLTE